MRIEKDNSFWTSAEKWRKKQESPRKSQPGITGLHYSDLLIQAVAEANANVSVLYNRTSIDRSVGSTQQMDADYLSVTISLFFYFCKIV